MKDQQRSDRGDTLVEVAVALAILSSVLVGATAVASTAFRMGQTAKERTQMAGVAQEQMEALRSVRDNHTWGDFKTKIVAALAGPSCTFDSAQKCFHMERTTVGATNEWSPVAGTLTDVMSVPGVKLPVPTAQLEITGSAVTACTYDFELRYEFSPRGGGGVVTNKVKTRLTDIAGANGVCP